MNNDKHANGVASPHDHAQRFNSNLDFEEAQAAEFIPFPRRWHGSTISANLEANWGMSACFWALYGDTSREAPQIRIHRSLRISNRET